MITTFFSCSAEHGWISLFLIGAYANDLYKTYCKISFRPKGEEWTLNFILLMTLTYILSMTYLFSKFCLMFSLSIIYTILDDLKVMF